MKIEDFQKKIEAYLKEKEIGEIELQFETTKCQRPFLKFTNEKGEIEFGMLLTYSPNLISVCIQDEKREPFGRHIKISSIIQFFPSPQEFLHDINHIMYSARIHIRNSAINQERDAQISKCRAGEAVKELLENFVDETFINKTRKEYNKNNISKITLEQRR
ncbi:MAG: hypothetical protein A3B95_02800 [Candidatus Doudnabacteria bacterium RIFCSPHIGHO2_02_FULL_43_13b]|nr:MAG: hypothetical protein A3B95_02800 [Candidatus Doudnabacteria bacterium RIFCSPHIGHO2_02_FULL_43_13b]